MWKKIKAGETLPCPAYIWSGAFEEHSNYFEGRLIPNVENIQVCSDTWYLPVDVVRNLPKEGECELLEESIQPHWKPSKK